MILIGSSGVGMLPRRAPGQCLVTTVEHVPCSLTGLRGLPRPTGAPPQRARRSRRLPPGTCWTPWRWPRNSPHRSKRDSCLVLLIRQALCSRHRRVSCVTNYEFTPVSVVDAARRTVPGKPEVIEELGEGRARDVLLREHASTTHPRYSSSAVTSRVQAQPARQHLTAAGQPRAVPGAHRPPPIVSS